MNSTAHIQKQPVENQRDPLDKKLVVLTQREHINLKRQGRFWKAQHTRAVERELLLKQELQTAKAEIVNLKQRLFGKKSGNKQASA